MKRILIVIFFVLPMILNAQTAIKGLVKEQNSGNKPISGVQIIVSGTQPEISDNQGKFQLFFSNKKPGDKVIITEVSKPGYQLLSNEYNTFVLSNDASYIAKIVMCSKEILKKNTNDEFQSYTSADIVGYKKKIKELELQRDKAIIDANTYKKKLEEIENQHQKQQGQMAQLAEKTARVNFDDCSDIHIKAHELFKSGNTEAAIKMLESVNSKNEIAKANEQLIAGDYDTRSHAHDVIHQNIEKLRFQANLYITNYRFREAEAIGELLVNADSTNFDNVYDFAYFLDMQNKFDKAQKRYSQAFSLASNDYDKSHVLYSLAILQRNIGQLDDAEVNLTNAMNIQSEISNYDDQILPELLSTLTTLAELQTEKGDLENATINYTAAIVSCYALTLTDMETYTPHLANIHDCLADLQCKKGKYQKSERNHLIALGIYETLAEEDFAEYGYDVAETKRRLGSLYQLLQDNIKAEKYYSEAVSICRSLTINDKSYLPDLAYMLDYLAFQYIYSNRLDISETTYSECLNIWTELAKINPDAYNPDLANIYKKIGDFYWTDGNSNMSEINYQKSIQLYKVLMRSDPQVYFYDLASVYGNLSFHQLLLNKSKAAESSAYEGLKVDPSQTWIKTNLAHALLLQNRYFEAKSIYLEYKDQIYPMDQTKTFKYYFLQDFNDLENAGITHPDIDKIRTLLYY